MSSLRQIRQPDPPPQDTSEEHLSIAEMDAYHLGSLPPQVARRLREHLVFCRECRDQFLDLVRFLEDDGSEGRVWSGEIAAVWTDWWASLKDREAQG